MRMRSMSLQVKVTLAIVASLLVIDGVAAAVAEVNFRQSETEHVQQESRSRVEAIAHVLDMRLHALGAAASSAAGSVGVVDEGHVSADLARAGFTGFVVLGPDDSVKIVGGEARDDPAVAQRLQRLAPPVPTQLFLVEERRFIVAVRSVDTKNVVVADVDHQTLMDTFFLDVLIEADDANVVISNDGSILGSSPGFAAAPSAALLQGDETTIDGRMYLASREPISGVDGVVVHLAPVALIHARADTLALKFLETATVATILAAAATVLLVRVAMAPLRRITEAAQRLGRGDEDLRLDVDSRDELGILAGTLARSAKQVGEARRAQQKHAQELRSAAEDFQLAVGALSRSVGEADSAAELARRLVDAALLVAPSRAALALIDGAVVEARALAQDADERTIRAFFESDRDAFRVIGDDEVALAMLLNDSFRDSETRKLEILLSQAKLALHRTRALEKVQVYMDILSHDLKDPLAVARGRVEMASAKFPAANLPPALDALDRAARIIEEAALHSRLERDRRLDVATVDLAEIAKEAARALAPLADARGIELEVSSPARVPWPANPLLARAVENVLSNAIKWSPDRATVLLDVEPCGDVCRIRVIDHGPGIRASDRARLFARFERLDRDGVKGVGLGLAIAKRVIDAHDGRIRIEETPGGGATFTIEIPRVGFAPASARAATLHKERTT